MANQVSETGRATVWQAAAQTAREKTWWLVPFVVLLVPVQRHETVFEAVSVGAGVIALLFSVYYLKALITAVRSASRR